MIFAEFENVSFGFRDENGNVNQVLKNISLKIEKGSFVTFLGRNGSGKSTAARIMNGLLKAQSGKVVINGILPDSAENIWEIRKSVGMVFQNPDNQIVESVVMQDIAFGCENLGIEPKEIKRRVDESLAAVEMSQHKEAMTAYLSGGQKQRIAIAGVLAMKPECIIFDESTSMLDPKGRRDIAKIMKKLNKSGITVINITHFMDEALMGDRVIIIDNGEIAKDGTAQEIFSDIEYMKSIKLDVPQISELAYLLRGKGFHIARGVSDKTGLFSEMSKYRYIECKENISEKNKDISESAVRLENVYCIYGQGTVFEKTALNDVSIEINKGDFAAVIGHTGSGKSTLMQCLNGLVKINGGKILYCNRDIYSDKAFLHSVRQKIGSVFQYPEYQLFEATVYDDVAFAPKNQKLSEEETDKRVLKALTSVGLSKEYCDKSPFQLSGGEKRRVAIAGILAMNPEVLILDEPTAALDPAGKEEILGYIKKIHDENNITVVIVSHSMEDTARFADKIIVMNGGKVEFSGSPQQVFERDIEKIGLGLPKMVETADYFTKMGYPLSRRIYDVSGMAEEIARHFEVGQ